MKQLTIERNDTGTYCLAADGVIINPSVRLADLIPEIKKATAEPAEAEPLKAEAALDIYRKMWRQVLHE